MEDNPAPRRKLSGDYLQLHWKLLASTELCLLDKVILEYLSFRANPHEGGHAWPGQDTIAERIGVELRTVKAAVKRLKSKGLITIDPRFVGRANGYLLDIPAIEALYAPARPKPQAEHVPGSGATPQIPPPQSKTVTPPADSSKLIAQINEFKKRYPPPSGAFDGCMTALKRALEREFGWTPATIDKPELDRLFTIHGETLEALVFKTFQFE